MLVGARPIGRFEATALSAMVLAFAWCCAPARAAGPQFGPEQVVQAGGGDLTVDGYSVPSCADWDNDGLDDLIVGEGGGGHIDGKVRVYLNTGSAAAPRFDDYFYAVSGGSALWVPAGGCLGIYPRVVDCNGDGKKDLLCGLTGGTVKVFLNVGLDDDPIFDAGTELTAGPDGAKSAIDVGMRATPNLIDWDNDGDRDLLVGGYDGKFHLYRNDGTGASPDYRAPVLLPDTAGGDLVLATLRASPALADLDGDGRMDLLAGDTDGRLMLYLNQGTDAAPAFSSPLGEQLTADGAAVDLPGSPRSRPCVVDWTGDGLLDVLVGSADGMVRLYEQVPEPGAVLLLAVATPLVLRRRRP